MSHLLNELISINNIGGREIEKFIASDTRHKLDYDGSTQLVWA